MLHSAQREMEHVLTTTSMSIDESKKAQPTTSVGSTLTYINP
jgi:hypothetical protein